MNKFLIAFSALLAVCSVCNAYGINRPVYGAPAEVLGQLAYQLSPQPTYRSGYGGQIAPGYGLPAPGYGGQILSGYGGNVGLPGYNQLLPISSPALLERGVYNSGAPLLIPNPLPGPLYSIPINAPQSASAAASASARGNRGKIPYTPASLVPAPGVIVGPAQGNAYAPAPGPIPAYKPAPAYNRAPAYNPAPVY